VEVQPPVRALARRQFGADGLPGLTFRNGFAPTKTSCWAERHGLVACRYDGFRQGGGRGPLAGKTHAYDDDREQAADFHSGSIGTSALDEKRKRQEKGSDPFLISVSIATAALHESGSRSSAQRLHVVRRRE
jgi:hypothetical protein